MFLSEWREFLSAPCLAGGEKKKKPDDSSRLDIVEIARVPEHASGLVSFLVGLRTYQHPGYMTLRYAIPGDLMSIYLLTYLLHGAESFLRS